MKKTLFVALVALMTAITAIAADNNPVNMTINLKNGLVVTYKAADMDSVRYVGGQFGDDGAIGMKIYLNGSTQSIDYLYSQIDDVTYTVVTTTTFTRVTNINQIETGKRYIIVCESMNGAMGGRYNNTFRALVTNGITLANGTATVNSDSEVTFFELGGTTGNYTLKVGNDYLSNPTSTTHLTTVSTLSNTEKWAITFDNNNAKIKNKGTSKFIYYFQDGGYFDAFTTGTAVQLYVEGTITPTDNNVNANWNIAGTSIPTSKDDPSFTNQSTDDYAWRLEYPHINTASGNQRVVKALSPYGITYSLEWDNNLIANRWTCYTMCSKNNASNVKRNDDFKADNAVTVSPSSSYTESSTYSRGHLCPSADRLASTEQNKQTFFMTNMQPQYQNHNSGVWGTLEGYVRTKWQPNNTTDTLYVVKAATIANVTLNNTSSTGIITTTTDGAGHTLVVPKYFYMAFLYFEKSTQSYKAFALWTEHLSSGNPNAATVIANRISIDELERRTGIDFFCNLPDDIETTVEATATYWDFSSNN